MPLCGNSRLALISIAIMLKKAKWCISTRKRILKAPAHTLGRPTSHPRTSCLFTIFHSKLKKKQMPLVNSMLPWNTQFFNYSFTSPLVLLFPLPIPLYNSKHVCVWLQVCMRLSAGVCSGWCSVQARWRRFVAGVSNTMLTSKASSGWCTLSCSPALRSRSAGEFQLCLALTYHFPHLPHTLCPLNLST